MKFTKTVLDNGLRIICVPMQDNGTVTAMVLVEAGSRYESNDNNGISHFLEHMCFKGTKNRPSVLEIATDFEKLGAAYNAFTAGDYTGYYAKVSSDKAEQAFEMVSDLYLHATLPENEIDKEKTVIIEEIKMGRDKPQNLVWETLYSAVYPGQSLGRNVIGPEDNIRMMTREEIAKYRETHYVPEKTVVIISGGLNEEEMKALVSKHFGKLEKKSGEHFAKVIDTQDKLEVKTFFKETDQSHLVIGYRSFSRFDDRVYAASVLSTILGGGMSSRLFQKIREELGLCYTVYASNHTEFDCGLFTIYAGVAHDKIELTIKEVYKECMRIIEEGITDEELAKAIDYKTGRLFLSLETSDQLADWFGFQEIDHEQIMTPIEYAERLKKVTKEQVISVARYIFNKDRATIAVVGPHQSKEDAWKDLLC